MAGVRPLSAKKKNTHLTMSAPSGLRVTKRKRLISVFGEGSRQSKELAKDLTSDNQRLCDSTGLEPITFRLLAGVRPYPQKKEKHPLFSECLERITGDEAKNG